VPLPVLSAVRTITDLILRELSMISYLQP